MGSLWSFNPESTITRKDFPGSKWSCGEHTRRFEGSHVNYGLWEANAEGRSILDFSLAYDFTKAETRFRKGEEHLMTYKIRWHALKLISFYREIIKKTCVMCALEPYFVLAFKLCVHFLFFTHFICLFIEIWGLVQMQVLGFFKGSL